MRENPFRQDNEEIRELVKQFQNLKAGRGHSFLEEEAFEKIIDYYHAYGNEVLSISVDGLSEAEQREQLERFASDIAPVLRKEIPSSVWENEKRGRDITK